MRRRKSRGADWVLVRVPGLAVVSLPAAWTDAVAPDPFVVLAGGAAPFRTADLLAVAELSARLWPREGRPGGRVRGILS